MKFSHTLTALFLGLTGLACLACSGDDDEPAAPLPPTSSTPDTLLAQTVDLGLSVRWATCNLGAEAPEKLGDLYAWGEVLTKQACTENNYFDAIYTQFHLNGERSIAATEYDAALVHLGEGWRMPTATEMEELVRACTWRQESQNGVAGMRGTAANGQSIFLPATGMLAGDLLQSTRQGCYWSSDLYADPAGTSRKAVMLTFFLGDSIHVSNYYRFEGMAIRPVYVNPVGTGGDHETTDPDDETASGDPGLPPSEEDYPDLTPDERTLVGYWSNSGGSREYCPALYLSADGRSFDIYQSQSNKWNWDYTWYTQTRVGHWMYDTQTRSFATSTGWQFSVAALSDWGWSGTYQKGSKTYNQVLRRYDNIYIGQFWAKRTNWRTPSGEPLSLTDYTIEEDEDPTDFTFIYRKSGETGTMTLLYPFDFSKTQMILRGAIDETLHLVWE